MKESGKLELLLSTLAANPQYRFWVEGWFDQLFPGRVLRKRGVTIDDPDAVYDHRMRLLLLWPFDADARLIGEDSYTNGAMCLPENIRKPFPDEIPPVYYDRLR